LLSKLGKPSPGGNMEKEGSSGLLPIR